MDCIEISLKEALLGIAIYSQVETWTYRARWFLYRLGEADFRALLVYNGGYPSSRWQDYSGGSYEIAKVAEGVYNYRGTDGGLLNWKKLILEPVTHGFIGTV